MSEKKNNPGQLVFGLDIGTRSVVGTVGYRTDETFHVVAQCDRKHDTRAMLDGQIHDIEKVGRTIKEVKEELEATIGKQLYQVCIAAAGRVLKTINSSATLEFPEETTIDAEHIYTLEMLGVEKAYEDFQAVNNTDMKFYCVGYTVVKYYMNGYPISTLERHKANNISVDLIATFLPDDVVDGLYKAVEIADLEVANLTLEPIAAMTAAIPNMYRMLNIALVDVGAGTSDISVTKDGSIIAYGMIPKAGDELTEVIASGLLLDFNEAEHVKIDSGKKSPIKFTDIMGLEHKVEPKEVHKMAAPVIADITKDISDKIKELNGDKPVSAVFVVGGGGKITGFTEALAKEMGIMAERVALRGEEVLKSVDYQFEGAHLDSAYVTPVGICLNFYDQKNNFIFVTFNDKRVKLYDNGHLTIADAAMQAGFPNEGLFPKRGPELNFTVNGKPHVVRGQVGEGAVVKLNGREVSLTSPIVAGDKIIVEESTEGEAASATVGSLLEYGSTISVIVNDKKIELPKFAEVNGNLQSEYYDIHENDDIRMLNYYTVSQIIEFMDVILNPDMNIYVNNKKADRDTLCYDNFSVIWTMEDLSLSDVSDEEEKNAKASTNQKAPAPKKKEIESYEDAVEAESIENSEYADDGKLDEEYVEYKAAKEEAKRLEEESKNVSVTVFVNGDPVTMNDKQEYVFVDIFDHIDFDLKNRPAGKGIVTMLNSEKAVFSQPLKDGDFLDIYWE